MQKRCKNERVGSVTIFSKSLFIFRIKISQSLIKNFDTVLEVLLDSF